MTKRRGASLINVMVFMMFAVMVTAQVFFFTKSSSDSLAEGREIMRYRLHLQSLVEEAKDALKIKSGTGLITHIASLHELNGTEWIYTNQLKYYQFFNGTKIFSDDKLDGTAWQNDDNTYTYHVSIHDLDYSFDCRGKSDGDFETEDRNDWTDKETGYGNDNAHKKLFAAMPFLSKDEATAEQLATTPPVHNYKITNRFYLIRAWTQLPDNYYGANLMYQVLVSRDELEPSTRDTYHNIETLSFQEVWY